MEFIIGLVVFVVFAFAVYKYKSKKPTGSGGSSRTPKSPRNSPRA